MPYPDHLLARGERVVLHKHPHWKVLVGPLVAFTLIITATSAGAAYAYTHTGDYRLWWIALGAVGALLLIFLTLVPFLKWRAEHFVITTRHVFFRTGVFQRREHQIPLAHVQNLETNVTFWGRILGFGTLTVESAADQPLSFYNVASLPRVQGELNQLIDDVRHAGRGRRDGPAESGEDSTGDGGPPHPRGSGSGSAPDPAGDAVPVDDPVTRRISRPAAGAGQPRRRAGRR